MTAPAKQWTALTSGSQAQRLPPPQQYEETNPEGKGEGGGGRTRAHITLVQCVLLLPGWLDANCEGTQTVVWCHCVTWAYHVNIVQRLCGRPSPSPPTNLFGERGVAVLAAALLGCSSGSTFSCFRRSAYSTVPKARPIGLGGRRFYVVNCSVYHNAGVTARGDSFRRRSACRCGVAS